MDIRDEFRGAALGDERLSRRLVEIGQRVALAPAASFPKAMVTGSALEASYRFLNNDNVEPEKILAPHIAQTRGRCITEDCVFVAHDTTEVGFPTARRGLGRANDGPEGRAFFLHTALAISGDGTRTPLGVVGARIHTRTGKPRRKKGRHSEKRPEPQRESYRWWRLMESAHEHLGEAASTAIHVCDREADQFLLVARAVDAGIRFIIRARHDRRIESDDGVEPVREPTLRHALKRLEGQLSREVLLAPQRRKYTAPNSRKVPRKAKLEFCATTIRVQRPKTEPSTRKKLPEHITLNVVHVREVDAPSEFEPIDWKLLTTEPIDTPEQIAAIVDGYNARWVIEEFFKSLKTGCALQQRQLESAKAIYNAVAVFLPVAWSLLRLRSTARHAPDAPAETVLDPLEIRILQGHKDVKLTTEPTVRQALLAVARLGGHIKNNGEPGWQVLGRGYLTLLDLVAGARIALGP